MEKCRHREQFTMTRRVWTEINGELGALSTNGVDHGRYTVRPLRRVPLVLLAFGGAKWPSRR
jgi:hypothetical protein